MEVKEETKNITKFNGNEEVESKLLSTNEIATQLGLIGNPKSYATNPTSDYREVSKDYNRLMRIIQLLVLTDKVDKEDVLLAGFIEETISTPE